MMSSHFTHAQFEHFEFEAIPRDRDLYLMDEQWIPEWEAAYLDFFKGEEFRNVGYISYVVAH